MSTTQSLHDFNSGVSKHNQTHTPCHSIANYLHRHGYRFGKIIGEGSYSKVRLTTRYFQDGSTAYRLASKIINKKRASEDFVKKFLPRELQIVSRLDHQNIVRVYDVVEFDDHVYIFMDWCDKGDLLEYIKAKGFVSECEGHHYFRQLISAIRYLHNLDLSHRDLKCENILMASPDKIRISDFGFARSCRDSKGKRILSSTYCGSAAYAAPEILQGSSYNPKLYDMWSMGCVLFIMLTGHMPYDESNIQKMLKNQLERILTYPAQVYGQISEKAKACIRRLLEPDVTKRANIDQVMTDDWISNPAPAPSTAVSRPTTSSSVPTPPTGPKDSNGEGDNDDLVYVSHNPAPLPKAPSKSPRSGRGDRQSQCKIQPQVRTPSSSKTRNLARAVEHEKIRVKTSMTGGLGPREQSPRTPHPQEPKRSGLRTPRNGSTNSSSTGGSYKPKSLGTPSTTRR